MLHDRLEIRLLMASGTCLMIDGGWFEWTLMYIRLSVRVVGVVGQVECNVEVVHDFQVRLYYNF